MSVLETFFFLFESDAEKLDRGLKESERRSESLERSLQDTDKSAGMVGGSLLKVAGAAAGALGGLLAFASVKATVMDVANAIDELGDAAAALDLPVEELSAWSMAATMTDGSQAGLIASLNTFNMGLNAIATKGKGLTLPFLKELGLGMADIKRGAKQPLWALREMSTEFAKLSKAEAAGLGAKLGLDQGTINLLTQGKEGIDKLIARQKELGVVTAAQVEQAGKFDETMKEWNATFADIKREFVITLLPPITEFLKTLRTVVTWMADHKGFVVGFFSVIAAVLAGVYLPAALASAAATWALIAPYVAIGAAVAAVAAIIALVAEDIYAFGMGHDSVLGKIVEKWPFLGQLIRDVGQQLAWLTAIVAAFGGFFVDLIASGPTVAIENFSAAIRALIADISDRFPIVGEVFEFVTGLMSQQIETVITVWDFLVAAVSKGIELFMRGLTMVKGIAGAAANLFGVGEANDEAPANRGAKPATGGPARVTTGSADREGPAAAARATLDTRTGAVRPLPRAQYVDPETARAVNTGRQQLAATASPIASQTSNSISNSTTRTTNRTTTVQTGPITVQTQAKDGAEVASALGMELNNHIRGAIDEHDDGVAA